MPPRSAKPADALLLHQPQGFLRRRIGIAAGRDDAHQHLVQHDLVEDLDGGFLAQPIGKPARQPAAALDELRDALRGLKRDRGYAATAILTVALVTAVGMLTCAVAAKQGLRINPAAALREE